MKSLTSCFSELFAYMMYFLKTVEKRQPLFDQVKSDIHQLLSKSEHGLNQGSFSREDYDLARFALCAWIDEAILNSPWKEKAQWQKERLQHFFYHTTEAGEEFFERLNSLGPHQREVREVYYLCLTIGFTGKYCQEGDHYLLEQLKTSNLRYLTGSSVGLPSLARTELFPEAYPDVATDFTPQAPKRFHFSLFSLLCLAGPVVFLVLLFIIYHCVLTGMETNILSMVP
ncbi:MAG: type IVB secretion system protein IcmH/DotU [bacterium]